MKEGQGKAILAAPEERKRCAYKEGASTREEKKKKKEPLWQRWRGYI